MSCAFAPSRFARATEPAFQSASIAPEPSWAATSGAFAATGDAGACWSGNPAVLAASPRSLALSHLSWAGGLNREWGAIAWPASSRLSAGLDAAAIRSADELPSFDENETALGSVAPVEWTAGGALAFRMTETWSLAVGARYHRLSTGESSLSGVGISAGVRASFSAATFGASVTDLGGSASAEGETYPLPRVIRVGVEHGWGRTTTSALTISRDARGVSTGAIGVRLSPHRALQLLGGCELQGASEGGESLTGWGAGARLEHQRTRVSYAYRPLDELGATHHLGLELSF